MNWIKTILALALICSLCACASKKFNTSLLHENRAKIDTAKTIQYYDGDSCYFYLLTFYKTIEKNAGEDFTFEGVSTYKGSQESESNVEGDSTIIQYLGLYFFKNGGVVYHTKYKIAPHEKYVPPDLTTFDDLYQKDKIRKRDDKIEFKRYQPVMQGYQVNKINAQEVVNPKEKETVKSPKDSMDAKYAAKNRQLFNQAVMEKPDSNQVESTAEHTTGATQQQQLNASVIKLFLERRGRKPFINLRSKNKPKKTGAKSPIFLLGKHLPIRTGQEEAILIEQIFYLQDVQSAGGRYIPALLSEVFDLGTVTGADTPFKPLFWFRLKKKDDFTGNLPNSKR